MKFAVEKSGDAGALKARTGGHKAFVPRIAILADYPEENWLSMDYFAEAVYRSLSNEPDICVSLLRPRMSAALTRLPVLRDNSLVRNVNRFRSRFLSYPAWLRPQLPDHELFHIIDHSYAHLALGLPHGRALVTCHDIDAFRCLLGEDAEPRPWWFRVFTRRILAGLRSASRVICDSRTAQRELVNAGFVREDKTVLVSPGVHATCSTFPDAVADAHVRRLLGETAASIDLLHVGSTIPRKNIEALLRIVAGVSARENRVRLIRVGGKFTDAHRLLIKELGIQSRIVELDYLERPALAAVYRRAALVLQPSLSEGFGLPVVEAMACGARVVASDIPVFHEIAGGSIDYCAAADTGEWIDRISGLIRQRREGVERWNRHREAALRRASTFTWKSHAEQLSALYQEVLASSMRTAPV